MNEASLADMKVGIADTCLVAEEGGRPRVLHDRNEGVKQESSESVFEKPQWRSFARMQTAVHLRLPRATLVFHSRMSVKCVNINVWGGSA